MKLSYRALVLPFLLVDAVLAQAILNWNCTRLPDVCQNMCWGAKCAGRQGAFTALTWDRVGSTLKRQRRQGAGCLPSPNRCSLNANPPHVQGYNCDEFPMASTSQADQGSQWTRCTPTEQNNLQRGSQGWVLGRFFQSAQGCGNNAPCNFQQVFGQVPTNVNHFCNANQANVATECRNTNRGANNEQEYINGNNLAQNPTRWKRQEDNTPTGWYVYQLESGANLTSSTNLTIGATVLSITLKDASSPEEQAQWDQVYDGLKNQTEDDIDSDFWGAKDDWNEVTDKIVKELQSPTSKSPTSTLSCTLKNSDPDQGIAGRGCICGSTTLPLLTVSSATDPAQSCAYTALPSTTGSNPISIQSTTYTSACQACTQAGEANSPTCTPILGCTTPAPTSLTTSELPPTTTSVVAPPPTCSPGFYGTDTSCGGECKGPTANCECVLAGYLIQNEACTCTC